MRRYHTFMIILMLTAATPSAAQQITVTGRIMAGTNPVGLAEVSTIQARGTGALPPVELRTLSDQRGFYRMVLLPGTYGFRVTMPGYRELIIDATPVQASMHRDFILEPQPIALEHISVTAQRKPEKATEAPAAVSVVDSRRIEEQPSTTPIDHVREVAGVQVATTGIQARNIVTRGFNEVFGTSLLMLSDNRYASLPSLRANLPYFLTPADADIERIEVLLGPASAAYGPNSADGVVHVITKSPFNSAGTTASVTVGERSLLHMTARHAGIVSDNLAYKVSAQRITADDWTATDPSELKPRDARIERYSAQARVDLRAGESTDFVFDAGNTLSSNAVEQTGLGNAQIKDYQYGFAQARVTHKEFFAQAFVNAANSGESFHLQTLDPIKDHSRLVALQAQYGNAIGTRSSIRYGVDYSLTDPRTYGSIDGRNENDDKYSEAGVYAQGETHLSPRLGLVGAARVDRHSRMDGLVLSPRVAAVFKPRSGHNFRLTYNRAFQNPTSTDLFLDLVAARLDPLPFALRAQGVPQEGYHFRRDCSGICVKSPFAATTNFIAADATQFWPAVTAIMKSAGVDLTGLPAPRTTDIRTDLRVLDLATGGFRPVQEAEIRSIDALEPIITNTIEAGYKGLMGERLLVSVSAYATRRENFRGPLQVETPNVFLNTSDLAAYLGRFMPAAAAAQLAAGIGGLPLDPAVTGIPLATVSPEGRLGGSDIIMTYRNTGTVDLYGGEVGGEMLINDHWSSSLAVSWTSDDFIPRSEAGGFADIALNAPRKKLAASVAYHDVSNGISGELRARAVDHFPMTSGVWVGTVPGYNVFDATVSARPSFLRGAMITVSAENLANRMHSEFFGAPQIGRMISTRLQYSF